jgi:lipoate-protein ligase A
MACVSLRASGTCPAVNLALEEALLEGGSNGDRALFLYVDEPCLVIGRNQNPWSESARGCALPLFRRISGGGAVYHDLGNLNCSLIVPRASHDPEAELALVAAALRPLGVDAAPGRRGGLFLASGPLAGRKISGSARRLSARRVLHHGTLLVDSDLGALERSLGGMEVESSRALPSVPSPVANLSEALPGLGLEDAARALAEGLAGGPGAIEAELAAERGLVDAARARLESWEWTWGETPPFTVGVPLGGERLRVELRRGRVQACPGAEEALGRAVAGMTFDDFLALAATASARRT